LLPEYPAALYLLAHVERQLGNLPRSTELLQKLVQIEPRDSDGQFLLGQNLLRLGKTQDAITRLKAAVDADPNNSDALYNLAQTLKKTGSGMRESTWSGSNRSNRAGMSWTAFSSSATSEWKPPARETGSRRSPISRRLCRRAAGVPRILRCIVISA